MEKIFLSANTLSIDSFQLAQKVYESGFHPNLIIGVLRGGAPISIAVHEYFSYQGVAARYQSIQCSSYSDIGVQSETIKVEGSDKITDGIGPDDKLLIVDDVFDTGRSMQTILALIDASFQRNHTERKKPDIRVATVWFKPENNLTDLEPNYFLHTTDKWLVFPHELEGLSRSEIIAHKPEISDMLNTD